jgi:hypothetical protein
MAKIMPRKCVEKSKHSFFLNFSFLTSFSRPPRGPEILQPPAPGQKQKATGIPVAPRSKNPKSRTFYAPATMPNPKARWNPAANRQPKATPSPHNTAKPLALKANTLPLSRTPTIRSTIARTSFSRIRTNTCASLPLFTLSTHRMVRSTSPLSTRSRTLNHSLRLRARVRRATKNPRFNSPPVLVADRPALHLLKVPG